MRSHTPFFELQAGLAEPGCPICRLTVRALERFFAAVVYERVNDRSLRDAIRRAYGFCTNHGPMVRAARSALGVAIIQRDVLRAAATALDPEALGRGPIRSLIAQLGGPRSSDGPLKPGGSCVGCALADEQCAHWIGILAQHYPALRSDFQASSGLCLGHVRVALATAPAAIRPMLGADQRTIWARLEADLDEFIRKHDHQFAAEPMGAESDSWARATDLLSGDARAFGRR
ncbi:MAG: hypothetical protein HC822_26125 [Oscillochloris sp.]|nr:hypothetical protein [Oscillochloris sp.]